MYPSPRPSPASSTVRARIGLGSSRFLGLSAAEATQSTASTRPAASRAQAMDVTRPVQARWAGRCSGRTCRGTTPSSGLDGMDGLGLVLLGVKVWKMRWGKFWEDICDDDLPKMCCKKKMAGDCLVKFVHLFGGWWCWWVWPIPINGMGHYIPQPCCRYVYTLCFLFQRQKIGSKSAGISSTVTPKYSSISSSRFRCRPCTRSSSWSSRAMPSPRKAQASWTRPTCSGIC